TPQLGATPNQSGQENLVVRPRCEAGKSAGCIARAVVRLRASATEITATAPARKRRSSSGSSLNRYAEYPLLMIKLSTAVQLQLGFVLKLRLVLAGLASHSLLA